MSASYLSLSLRERIFRINVPYAFVSCVDHAYALAQGQELRAILLLLLFVYALDHSF